MVYGAAARASGDAASMVTYSFKSLPVSKLKVLPVDDMVAGIKGLDNVEDVNKILKNLDDAQLANIGKKLDTDFVKKLDPDLAKKLKPDGVFKKAGTTVTNAARRTIEIVGGSLGAMRKSFPELLEGAKKVTYRPLKSADGTPKLGPNGKPMTELTVEGTQAGKHVKKVSEVEMTPEQAKKLKDVDELVENVPAAREGLMKTGMYVAGGTAFLMLMYDTLNPFEAIKKAVDDTGEVVQGLKEVADEAADAAKDVAKGGFDFVSFVTNNSWLSSLSSVLCLILVFAVVAMSFLGGK
jgi:hypothetical protein